MFRESTLVGVVIPTRNRPNEIAKLLSSLSLSEIPISVVVVVASGIDIEGVVDQFRDRINLIYVYSSEVGQVRQKAVGIGLLPADTEWCVFTDDDLLFNPGTIKEAISAALSFGEEVLGVGFSLPSQSRTKNLSKVGLIFGRVFGLYGFVPGSVLKSGQGVNYLSSTRTHEVEWLNGVSMWRYPEVLHYVREVPSSDYAACEDLFFSYAQRKKGKLIFCPTAKVQYQESELTNPENLNVFISAAYWRLVFVMRNNELSIWAFFFSQIARTLYASFKGGRKRHRYFVAYLGLIFDYILSSDEVQLFAKLDRRLRHSAKLS